MSAGIGQRCKICTGCGDCVGTDDKMHVLTENADYNDAQPILIRSDEGERLVTVDIGTTTIAMLLYNADGTVQDRFVSVNPQTAYGADVLTRIQAAEKPEDARQLKEMVRGVLREGISRFQSRVRKGEILRMVIAANTTMVYLLMGWNTAELGRTPFSASHLEAVQTVIEGISCYIFPGLSAFVGGDIVSGMLSLAMTKQKKITLLIDLGTNGEMVLGNAEKLIACSTAAGPAFEGGVNRGVWGADMVSLLAILRRKKILDETGLLAEPYFETGIRVGNVQITQESVRAVQLAKAAVRAGVQILLREYGITEEQVDQVVLAGGFGYYLNPYDAAEIGILPKNLASKTIAGGNTALAGALCLGRALLDGKDISDDEFYWNADCRICILNLAVQSGFEELYIESMGLQ